MDNPRIALIILNWNGKKDTLACLNSLEKISSPSFDTIVVDNGSTDDSIIAIKEKFPHVTLIETGKNLGFAEGNNVGIRFAIERNCDFIFLLNNDTIVEPSLLTSFLDSARRNPQAGIFGAKIYLFDHPRQFDHLGGMWNEKKGEFDLIANRLIDDNKSWEKEMEIDYACGAAIFIRKEVFQKIGLLEPKFFLIWEESDFCFRAKKQGFSTLFCPQAIIWHRVSASFSGKPHSTYFWWRNRLLWIERNCTPSQFIILSLTQLLPQAFKLLKLKLLKSLQNFFSPTDKRLSQQLLYSAALTGILHYLLRRFGPGPSWITKK